MFIFWNSCSKHFVNFQEKNPCESCRLLPDTCWECSPGKFPKFSEQLLKKHLQMVQMVPSAISCH